jgi:hypothetical protein
MFSMWSEPSLLRNNGKAAFSTRSIPRQQWKGRFLCGLFTGYIVQMSAGSELVKESVMTSDGKGRHKSWLQQLEPESSEILRVE